MEYIGKILLDHTHYSGQDLYCDGDVEDELLEIVRNEEREVALTEEERTNIIEERADWPTFYHLSSQRHNIVEWLPMNRMTKVLEVGSGCGAITSILAQKAGEVHSIELSKKRSQINAYRNRGCDNVTIHLGNFKDIEPDLSCDYDYVLLIGVFEYANSYMGGEQPYSDFMQILRKHLKPDGRLVIAIENQFGLKYWAGCKEDHLGTYFSGLEDYQGEHGVRTFTKRGLESILQENEIEDYHFYYPYPDYKFMTTMYSHKRLPKIGELVSGVCNYDRERMLLFDETLVYDTILQEEQFPLFSNSYLVVTGPPIPLIYSKYSNERKPEYAIRTDVIEGEDGSTYVAKTALTKEAESHIQNMKQSYELLHKRYKGSKIVPNHIISKKETELQFEYVEGVTLESKFDELLLHEDRAGFLALYEEYYKAISYNKGVEVANLDFIFSNIILREDEWTIIDYEWVLQEHISDKTIAYRAFYCYTLGATHRQGILEEEILAILDMSEEEAKSIQNEEVSFQQGITGSSLVKAQICQRIGNPVLTMQHASKMEGVHANKIQIYEDCGKGFSEEQSYLLQESELGDNQVILQVDEHVKNLRIDPCMQACVVTIQEITWDGEAQPALLKKIETNGVQVDTHAYYFATSDPNLMLPLKRIKRSGSGQLEVHYTLSRLV
ncbi:MAG: class I SAM-dependent methyltransferase [Eubacteriales bacterium]